MRPWPIDPRCGVTEDGRVFRTVPIGAAKAREITRHLAKRGYYVVQLEKKWFYVHRMVAQTYLGDPAGKEQVAHNNGVRTDNRVENLRWATPKENSADMVEHDTKLYGERHPSRILSEMEVLTIYKLTKNKRPRAHPYHREIAEDFGVTRECVTRIANDDRWKHATSR